VIWFTSDQHMWHANILKYNPNRAYATVEEMNEAIVRNWNSVVKQGDTVYCLGDFSFAPRSIELYSRRLQGIKKLVPGNHDVIHPANKKFKQAVKQGKLRELRQVYIDNGWELLSEIGETLEIPGVAIVNLNHMPYDTQDARYQDYKPFDDGRWLLHGHTHSLNKQKGRMIHVGVDAWDCTPVSLDIISKIIMAGEK